MYEFDRHLQSSASDCEYVVSRVCSRSGESRLCLEDLVDSPESTFSTDTQVLQNEPYAHFAVVIVELERADTETPDEVTREHPSRLSPRVTARWRRVRMFGPQH